MLRLTQDDMKRLNKEGIEYLIKQNEELSKTTASKFERKQCEEEIIQLKKLLKNI